MKLTVSIVYVLFVSPRLCRVKQRFVFRQYIRGLETAFASSLGSFGRTLFEGSNCCATPFGTNDDFGDKESSSLGKESFILTVARISFGEGLVGILANTMVMDLISFSIAGAGSLHGWIT